MIYFAQNVQTKAIKIGYSKNPKKRRAGLQSASEVELVLLGAIHGGLEHEYAYHQKFAQYRIKGEWFRPEILPAVMDIIARNPTDRPPPSNVIVIGDSENDFMWSSDSQQMARKQKLERDVFQALDELHAKNPIAWVITGADKMLEHFVWQWAAQRKVEPYRYMPKWSKYGRFAAFKVGPQMLRAMFDPKMVLAFLEEKPGSNTLSLIRRAEKMGIEVVIKGRPVISHLPGPTSTA